MPLYTFGIEIYEIRELTLGSNKGRLLHVHKRSQSKHLIQDLLWYFDKFDSGYPHIWDLHLMLIMERRKD